MARSTDLSALLERCHDLDEVERCLRSELEQAAWAAARRHLGYPAAQTLLDEAADIRRHYASGTTRLSDAERLLLRQAAAGYTSRLDCATQAALHSGRNLRSLLGIVTRLLRSGLLSMARDGSVHLTATGDAALRH